MINVLIGMIASGKSTYATQMAEQRYIIVNDDNIVSALHGNHYTRYEPSLKPLYKSIENHIISMAVAMGKNIIIDRGLDVSPLARRRWIALASSLDVECNAIVFRKYAPEFHATRRFKADNRGHAYDYWLRIARFHETLYKHPTVEEGFTKIIEVTQFI